jgi:hypothetical protein
MNNAIRRIALMIAAIYVRKSTDRHVPEEEQSVTRQLEALDGGRA